MLTPGESRFVCVARSTEVRKNTDRSETVTLRLPLDAASVIIDERSEDDVFLTYAMIFM